MSMDHYMDKSVMGQSHTNRTNFLSFTSWRLNYTFYFSFCSCLVYYLTVLDHQLALCCELLDPEVADLKITNLDWNLNLFFNLHR